MVYTPDLAAIAATIGEPSRARMVMALMDGRALTATELALEGGVTASTASSHLARLEESGLVSMTKQGRHRYFRIGSPDVAEALEGFMRIAPRMRGSRIRTGPRDEALRRARVCYDHLAGALAVRLLERLQTAMLVDATDDSLALTTRGEAWCERLGIDMAALRAKRRPLCRACLDWSERRTHLAGAVGAALLEHLFAKRYARRLASSRAVTLTARGESFIEHPFVTA
jgi:DNA-binding transcriptional ArsR family regulator